MSTNKSSPMPAIDAIDSFRSCSDRFGAMRTIFKSIADGLPEGNDLRLLAIAGADVAFEYEQFSGDCKERIEQAGIRQ